MGEAEIGLNIMPSEAEIWFEIFFPEKGCVCKLLYFVINGTTVKRMSVLLFLAVCVGH